MIVVFWATAIYVLRKKADYAIVRKIHRRLT